MLFILACLFAAVGLGYFFYNQMDKQERVPTLERVRKAIERFGRKFSIEADWSEEDLEKHLCQYLQIHFPQVRRQFHVGDISRRERIDIDIANGTFGIEVKLASLVKKTNERNRLLGQVDTYQTRRYGKHRLLVVLAGEAGWDSSPIGLEMKKILEQKNAGLVFLKIKKSKKARHEDASQHIDETM